MNSATFWTLNQHQDVQLQTHQRNTAKTVNYFTLFCEYVFVTFTADFGNEGVLKIMLLQKKTCRT